MNLQCPCYQLTIANVHAFYKGLNLVVVYFDTTILLVTMKVDYKIYYTKVMKRKLEMNDK